MPTAGAEETPADVFSIVSFDEEVEMPRRPRNTGPGACHHVMARGNDGGRIFIDDEDRRAFLRALEPVVVRNRWSCLAYCLMGTHLHLCLSTPEGGLSAGMRDLLARHAREVNRRHGRTGHLFKERFRSVDITSDAQLLAVIRYIARNPVEAGLSGSPEGWPWSSYPATLGMAAVPRFLSVGAVLALFAPEPSFARRGLREFVGPPAESELVIPSDLGAVGGGEERVGLPTVEEILGRHGHRDGPALCVAAGHSQAAVARALGLSPQAVSQSLRRRKDAGR